MDWTVVLQLHIFLYFFVIPPLFHSPPPPPPPPTPSNFKGSGFVHVDTSLVTCRLACCVCNARNKTKKRETNDSSILFTPLFFFLNAHIRCGVYNFFLKRKLLPPSPHPLLKLYSRHILVFYLLFFCIILMKHWRTNKKKKKKYSGVHLRVSTLQQPSFQKIENWTDFHAMK